jgi:predicted nucleotidyltransferase
MNLEQEAVRITHELGDVVFVGAFAVNYYAKFRTTKDIDLAMAGPLDEAKLGELGYTKKEGPSNSWYTPRGVQVDIYTRDVGKIPIDWILRTAVSAKVGRKRIKVFSLEGLLVSKHRAGRSQDVADLRQLVASRSREIRWEVMCEIASKIETDELRKVAEVLGT